MTDRENARNQSPRKVGRPRKRQMPEPIPDTPENIARTLMTTPPPDQWEYLKDQVEGENE